MVFLIFSTYLFLLDILPYAIIHSAAVMPATPTMALWLWANLLKAGAIFRFVSFSPFSFDFFFAKVLSHAHSYALTLTWVVAKTQKK